MIGQGCSGCSVPNLKCIMLTVSLAIWLASLLCLRETLLEQVLQWIPKTWYYRHGYCYDRSEKQPNRFINNGIINCIGVTNKYTEIVALRIHTGAKNILFPFVQKLSELYFMFYFRKYLVVCLRILFVWCETSHGFTSPKGICLLMGENTLQPMNMVSSKH